MELRSRARENPAHLAPCLLAAFGQEHDDDAQDSRAFVGAMMLAETMQDLRLIRQALTKGK